MNTLTQRETQPAPAKAEREPTTWLLPAVNVFETQDGYVLEAEMPGVNKNGLEITLEDNELTIYGRREFGAPWGTVVYRESKPVHFRRTFELDPAIDAHKIQARME